MRRLTARERRRRERQATGDPRPFAALTDEVAELLDRRPSLYPCWRALSRRLGASGGAGEIAQRGIVVRDYIQRGRAASTYWRHRRDLVALGLLEVGPASSGPRFGPGARRLLRLPLHRVGRRPVPAAPPAPKPNASPPPAQATVVQDDAPRGPPGDLERVDTATMRALLEQLRRPS